MNDLIALLGFAFSPLIAIRSTVFYSLLKWNFELGSLFCCWVLLLGVMGVGGVCVYLETR